jgi:hypothetical protein
MNCNARRCRFPIIDARGTQRISSVLGRDIELCHNPFAGQFRSLYLTSLEVFDALCLAAALNILLDRIRQLMQQIYMMIKKIDFPQNLLHAI